MRYRRCSTERHAQALVYLYNGQEAHGLSIHLQTHYGQCVTVESMRDRRTYRAVVLHRSSDWYRCGYHHATPVNMDVLCICMQHDACLPVPVYEMETYRHFRPYETFYPDLTPVAGDDFARLRKTHKGHALLVTACYCQRKDALARLKKLPPGTQRRIRFEVRHFATRKRGRPVQFVNFSEEPR